MLMMDENLAIGESMGLVTTQQLLATAFLKHWLFLDKPLGIPRLREQSSKSLQRLAALSKHFDVLDPGNSPNTFRNTFCKHSGSLQNPSIEKTSILIFIPSSFLSFSWRNISIC